MGVREDFFRLKEACIRSTGEAKEKAEREMDAFFASLSPEDGDELKDAVTEDFDRIHKVINEATVLKKRIEIRKVLAETLPFISVSEFAKQYFGKSASWLHQRINGNEVHGKSATFTDSEMNTLANALKDVAAKLNKAASIFAV
ncbi:DUF5053 domain-containing protein [Bacteroides sp.]|uniref:DUF5053 domain-containing protein n=2 Tax=Bacteroides sp. TaxID=29523 RepID=UPI001B5A018D|nr:DUF5053 domain-containing protein [Bacteroides sp.]MBP8622673.1 DUF5053 domain-containing protein [Bacteroides sp.]